MRKDVIILKQFCKANGCYGSETYLHGFSGYSLELLIIKYGGLQALLNEVLLWTPGVYIDIEKTYKDIAAALEVIGAHASPLILIDPTNPKRNVCGSLNTDNFARFVFSVKKFFAEPSYNFFVEKDYKKHILAVSKIRGTKLFKYSTKIVGPRDKFLSIYNKNLSKLIKELGNNNVSIYDSTPLYYDEHVELLLQVENMPITNTKRILGPNVWLDFENLNKFLKEHEDTYLFGQFTAYDRTYTVTNFNKFISDKIKEFISTKSILKN